jgi:plastocyanin
MKLSFALAALTVFACGQAGAASVTVTVSDSAGKPLADTVIVVDPEPGVAFPKPLKAGRIDQRGLAFHPLVSVIQTGSELSFPNYDKVKHHIYSFSPAKKFDQKLYSGVAAAPQIFDKAGTVVLGCNIHDRMVAYVKVVDSPYFAKTDAAGTARIELPAAGKYTVSAWHYNMSGATASQAASVPASAAAALSFKLALKPPVVEEPSSSY